MRVVSSEISVEKVLNGRMMNGMVLVTFDPLPTVGGIVLPERYLIQEADQDGEIDAYGVVTDRRLINPQTVNIYSGDYAGQKAFVYYGAYEIAKWVDDSHAMIPERTIYFLIEPIRMLPDFYLGEEVFSYGEQTESGIFITPYAERKEGVRIKLTHVCNNEQYSVGDTVITTDQYQYTLTYCGKKYVKLTDVNIIGIERDGKTVPTNNTVLVQYQIDPELKERIVENDRRKERRDLINKYGLHYSTAHANGQDPDLLDLPEPKTIKATLLDISPSGSRKVGANIGDTILVMRNYGCLISNDTYLIGLDIILWRE